MARLTPALVWFCTGLARRKPRPSGFWLKVGLGPEQVIARGVPWPYLGQVRDGTTISAGACRMAARRGKYPIHYTAISSRRPQDLDRSGSQTPIKALVPSPKARPSNCDQGPCLFTVHAEHIGNKVFETNCWITHDSYRNRLKGAP